MATDDFDESRSVDLSNYSRSNQLNYENWGFILQEGTPDDVEEALIDLGTHIIHFLRIESGEIEEFNLEDRANENVNSIISIFNYMNDEDDWIEHFRIHLNQNYLTSLPVTARVLSSQDITEFVLTMDPRIKQFFGPQSIPERILRFQDFLNSELEKTRKVENLTYQLLKTRDPQIAESVRKYFLSLEPES
jgi:hypothetical protein